MKFFIPLMVTLFLGVPAFASTSVEQLPSSCTHATDECMNTCMKTENGDWACTKMSCDTKVDAVCTQSTEDDTNACTLEYMPVCGIDGKTYGNNCMAGDVEVVYSGECTHKGDDKTQEQQIFDFAMDHKLTSATTIETFRPTDSVTRQEAAAIFTQMALSMKPNVYVSDALTCKVVYDDDRFIADDLKATVYKACAMDIMVGNKGDFYPYQALTRGQAFSVIMKMLDGPAKNPTTPMWLSYTNRSNELGLMTFAANTKFDQAVTRWELIEWIYTLSQKMN